jgi:hypothetical protein
MKTDVVESYHRMASREERRELLRALALESTPEAFSTLAELLAEPGTLEPLTAEDALVALGPLFEARRSYDPRPLFPRLIDALQYPAIAAMVLDLANHVTRRKLVERHPAADLGPRMQALFSGTLDGLKKLQTQRLPETHVKPSEKTRRQFDQSCSLLIALADTLGLIGERSAISVLRRGLELGHRRLLTEIAAALARLGEDEGIESLVQMTGQTPVRNRAVAYLRELGLDDRVPPKAVTPEARAEGELAEWLAEPMQFGLPPHEMELVERQRQFWPGYDQPVDCFLFRYAYRLPGGEISGVGIVGPATHSLMVDFDDWPPADIYAAYAGWQAEHTEIVERPIEELSPEARIAAHQRCAALAELGYEDARPVKIGSFFGQEHLVATARRGSDPGVVIVADGRATWYRSGNRQRPVGVEVAYFRHKGRELLRAFNAPELARG